MTQVLDTSREQEEGRYRKQSRASRQKKSTGQQEKLWLLLLFLLERRSTMATFWKFERGRALTLLLSVMIHSRWPVCFCCTTAAGTLVWAGTCFQENREWDALAYQSDRAHSSTFRCWTILHKQQFVVVKEEEEGRLCLTAMNPAAVFLCKTSEIWSLHTVRRRRWVCKWLLFPLNALCALLMK